MTELETKVKQIHELKVKLDATDYEMAKATENIINSTIWGKIATSINKLDNLTSSDFEKELVSVLKNMKQAFSVESGILSAREHRRAVRTQLENLIEDVTTNYLNEQGEPYYTKDTLVGVVEW